MRTPQRPLSSPGPEAPAALGRLSLHPGTGGRPPPSSLGSQSPSRLGGPPPTAPTLRVATTYPPQGPGTAPHSGRGWAPAPSQWGAWGWWVQSVTRCLGCRGALTPPKSLWSPPEREAGVTAGLAETRGCGGAWAAACPPLPASFPLPVTSRRRGARARTSPAAPGVLVPGVSSGRACLKRRGQQGLSPPPALHCQGPATPPLEARLRATSGTPQSHPHNLACTRIAPQKWAKHPEFTSTQVKAKISEPCGY